MKHTATQVWREVWYIISTHLNKRTLLIIGIMIKEWLKHHKLNLPPR